MLRGKKKHRGAILIEMVLCVSVNLTCFLGGLEFGWYFHVRQALAGAAGQTVWSPNQNSAPKVATAYLQGMNLPQSLVDVVVVDFPPATPNGPGGAKTQQATVSLPLSQVLLFGGVPSFLASSDPQAMVRETAYLRE